MSSAHSLTLMHGWHSPPLSKYQLPPSVGGKQPDGSKGADAPVWSFGKPGSRFLYGYGTPELDSQGTFGKYAVTPAIGPTNQPDAARANVPRWKFGTSTREHSKKVWITKAITQSLRAGSESPGPATYAPVCETGGKQPDSAHPDAPAWTMRAARRDEHSPASAARRGGITPGPKYRMKRGLGRERAVADPLRSEPAWSFGSKERPPDVTALPPPDSPGCIYALPPAACGKQVFDCGGVHGVRPSGAKPSAPKACFTVHSRWHAVEKELERNTVPGPGHYG